MDKYSWICTDKRGTRIEIANPQLPAVNMMDWVGGGWWQSSSANGKSVIHNPSFKVWDTHNGLDSTPVTAIKPRHREWWGMGVNQFPTCSGSFNQPPEKNKKNKKRLNWSDKRYLRTNTKIYIEILIEFECKIDNASEEHVIIIKRQETDDSMLTLLSLITLNPKKE